MQSRRSIFISATSRGFAWWREYVADILIAQDIQPLEQTWLTPEREVLPNEIKRRISSATGIVCLIGPYYGYPSQERLEDGRPLSYTQCEWLWALGKNKPWLVYLIEDCFFGAGKIESEIDPQFPDSCNFRRWQAEFRHGISKRYAHRYIKSPEALAISLAKINWKEWPP
jgi:uncharacterized protein DUF4062